MKNNALVFNIQKYSVHDGPGIRTIVFLKGCPLNCPWCANPEGKSFKRELYYNESLCRQCGKCIPVCPNSAIRIKDHRINIDRQRCRVCGTCVAKCPANAYKIFGEEKKAEDILKEVARDEVFYKRSGGGLTLSGGEPLSRGDFALELLKRAKEHYGLHTAVETTGYVPKETMEKVLPYIDFIFVDIKLMDANQHEKIIGVSNHIIHENIKLITDKYPDKPMVLRLPLVPGYNDSPENIKATGLFIRSLSRPVPLEILPYHLFGKGKYKALGHLLPSGIEAAQTPSREEVERVAEQLEALGVAVICT